MQTSAGVTPSQLSLGQPGVLACTASFHTQLPGSCCSDLVFIIPVGALTRLEHHRAFWKSSGPVTTTVF